MPGTLDLRTHEEEEKRNKRRRKSDGLNTMDEHSVSSWPYAPVFLRVYMYVQYHSAL